MRATLIQLKRRQKESPGFTFIEILVVVAILAILVVLSMAGIRNYGQRQQYLEFARAVGDGVSEARAKTIAGVGETKHGVYVSPTTIEFFTGSSITVGDPANTIIPVPSYITASSSFAGGVQHVTFERLTGEPSATGTIMIGHRRQAATTTFTIFESGLVQ